MEQRPDDSRLNYHYHGNTDHKLKMLGLVTDNEHGYEHSNAAAQSRENKQALFGGAQFNAIFLGNFLVVNANYDRNYRNDSDIR